MNRYQERKAAGVETLAVYLDRKTAKALTKRAKINNRSRSAEVVTLIKSAIEAA